MALVLDIHDTLAPQAAAVSSTIIVTNDGHDGDIVASSTNTSNPTATTATRVQHDEPIGVDIHHLTAIGSSSSINDHQPVAVNTANQWPPAAISLPSFVTDTPVPVTESVVDIASPPSSLSSSSIAASSTATSSSSITSASDVRIDISESKSRASTLLSSPPSSGPVPIVRQQSAPITTSRGHASPRGSVGVDPRPSSQSIATNNNDSHIDGKSSPGGTSIPSMIRAVSSPVSRVEYKARAAAISPTPLVPLQPIVAQEMPFLPPVTRQLSRDPYHTYLAELLAMGIDLEKATKALSYCESRSLQEALDFVFPHAAARFHVFLLPPHRREAATTAAITSPPVVAPATTATATLGNAPTSSPQLSQTSSSTRKGDIIPDDVKTEDIACYQCSLKERDHPPLPIPDAPAVGDLFGRTTNRWPAITIPPSSSTGSSLSVAITIKPAVAVIDYAADEQARKAAEEKGLLTCMICCDWNKTKDDMWKASCVHEVCKDCMTGYLTANITTGKVTDLRCMDPSCPRKMDDQEIKDNSTADLYAKYQRFALQIKLASDPSVRFCQTRDCGEVMRGTSRKPHLTCGKCRAEHCFNCNKPWHGRISCNKVADTELEKWMKGNDVRKCPRCKAIINKTDGCNHMTCSRCRNEFCWLCGTRYTKLHFMPFNPFGCAGLQFSSQTWPWYKIWAWRLLLLIAACIALPFAIVFGPSVLFVIFLQNKTSWIDRHDGCSRQWRRVAWFIFGLIFVMPIMSPLVLALGPFVLFGVWCYMRCESYGADNYAYR